MGVLGSGLYGRHWQSPQGATVSLPQNGRIGHYLCHVLAGVNHLLVEFLQPRVWRRLVGLWVGITVTCFLSTGLDTAKILDLTCCGLWTWPW